MALVQMGPWATGASLAWTLGESLATSTTVQSAQPRLGGCALGTAVLCGCRRPRKKTTAVAGDLLGSCHRPPQCSVSNGSKSSLTWSFR
jgi:hypothetical protein